VRFNKVISYGSVWEQYFEQCWNDPSVTLTNLASELDVIPFTLRRHAIRLKLAFPRPGPWARPTSLKVINEYSNTRQTFEESMTERRNQWLSVRRENPKATRKQLIGLAPYAYYWLNRHSLAWLMQNLPASNKNNPSPVRVDWKAWDVTLSKEVRKTAKQIRETQVKPIRVSKEEIINRLGHRSWIEQKLSKLPKTSQALALCLESREDFLVRRVKLMESHFQSLGRCPTYHQIDVRAGTRTKNGQDPRVRKALETALEKLQVRFGSV
jgi:hypothetical protein